MADVAAVLNILLTANATQANAQLAKTQANLTATQRKAEVTGAAMKKAMLGVGVAAAGAAVALYKIGEEFDDAYDKIRTGTGATGKELKRLEQSFRDVVADVPASFDDASTAVADLNTRLGLAGKPLEKIAKQVTELSRITGTDVKGNVEGISKAFNDWDVGTKKMGRTLDGFYRLSQNSGVAVSDLTTAVQQFGSPLRQLGFSLGEAAATWATFVRAGVNTQTMVPGLKLAIASLTAPTDDLRAKMDQLGIAVGKPDVALRQILDLLGSQSTLSQIEKTTLAMEVFGKRAGADMAEAIKQGRFEVDDMLATFRNGDGTIRESGRQTMDLAEQWQQFTNLLKLKVEPIASKVFQGLGDLMKEVTRAFKRDGISGVMDLLIDKINDALPKVMEAGGQIATKLLAGIAKAWWDSDILGKLFIGMGLVRLLGGPGALGAAGAKVMSYVFRGSTVGPALANTTVPVPSTSSKLGAGLLRAGKVLGGAALAYGVINGLTTAIGDGRNTRGLEGALDNFATGAFRAFGVNIGKTTAEEFDESFQQTIQDAGVAGLGKQAIITPEIDDKAVQMARERMAEINSTANDNMWTDGSFTDEYDRAISELMSHVKARRKTTEEMFADTWDAMTPDEQDFARRFHGALVAADRFASKFRVTLDTSLADDDPLGFKRATLDLDDNFSAMRRGVFTSMGDIRQVMHKSARDIAKTTTKGSQESRDQMSKNYRLAARNIGKAMDRGEISVRKGTRAQARLIRKAKVVSATEEQARRMATVWAKGMDKQKDFTGKGVKDIIKELKMMSPAAREAAQATWLGQLREAARNNPKLKDEFRDLRSKIVKEFGIARGDSIRESRRLDSGVSLSFKNMDSAVAKVLKSTETNLNKALSAMNVKPVSFGVTDSGGGGGKKPGRSATGGTFATGGVVVPGSGSGDKVPLHVGGQLAAMVEPGEYVSVANRNATKALMATNAAVPRFASGGVIQQALGPYDMPPIAYDPNHAGGNSHLHLDFFTKQQALAYGHRMQGMGWTIGEYSGSNPYGFGPVTVQHQSPGHYDGTAFDANTAADETRAEVEAVVRLLGGAIKGGAAGGVAERIKRLTLKGPDGPMKNMGQAAIDKATKAANAYIAKHMPTDTGPGNYGYVSGGNGAVAAQIGHILLRSGFDRAAAAGIIGNAYRESLWNPASVGSGGGGLWGFTTSPISLADLQAFAKSSGKPWTDVGLQTQFMLNHLSGSLKEQLNATNSPEAAAALFMTDWERPGVRALEERQAAARRAFNMKSWQRGGIVAKLAEGGLLTPATLSAMAKPSTPGAYPLPGGGEITGGPAVDGISESIMSLLGSTARDKGENPNSYDHGVTRIKDYIDSLGLKKGMLDGLKDKAAQIALLGENADSASSLGGAVGGKSQVEWLKDQLEAMFEYRWMLIKVEAAAKGRAREVAKFVRKLEHEIARMEKIVKRNQDREQDFKDAVKKAKGKDEKEAAEGRLKAFQAMLGGQQAKLGLLKGVVLPGANRKLAGLRGQLDVEGDGAAAALQTLQGIGATKKKLRFTEPFGAELGLLKGDILNTQITLRDALTAGTDDGRDSAVADLLRQQLAASQRDNALLRAQMPVFQSMVPYMGAFAAGGVALVGENGPELASLPSGTRVTSAADTRSMLEPEVALILNGCTIDTHGQTLQEAVKVAVNGELREIGRINERRTPTKV